MKKVSFLEFLRQVVLKYAFRLQEIRTIENPPSLDDIPLLQSYVWDLIQDENILKEVQEMFKDVKLDAFDINEKERSPIQNLIFERIFT